MLHKNKTNTFCNRMAKTSKQKLIAAGVLIAFTVAIYILSRYESISEWMARYIYMPWASFFGPLFSHVDFDVFEVTMFLLAVAAVTMVVFIIYYFVHKNNRKAVSILLSLVLMVVSLSFIYTSLASIMYNRAPLDIDETSNEFTIESVQDEVNKYFFDFETIAALQTLDEEGKSVCPYSEKELIQKIKDEYSRLISSYYSQYTPNPKQVASSYLMSAFCISGISFIPTVEPGYNYQMPTTDKVVTIAHELAHTKGVMREYDANELAYYILLTSSDPYLKYVGFLYTYTYMQSALRYLNFEEYPSAPACAIKDRKYSSAFWEKKGVFYELGDKINSLYLKSENQEGTQSYSSKTYYHTKTIIDEYGNEKIIYVVDAFSHVHRMIFELYN